jgi:hypothetical protein
MSIFDQRQKFPTRGFIGFAAEKAPFPCLVSAGAGGQGACGGGADAFATFRAEISIFDQRRKFPTRGFIGFAAEKAPFP